MILLAAASIYWHLPILIILVSLIYSASRFDEWERILAHALRGGIYIVVFLGSVFVVLMLLSSVLPNLLS